MGCAATGCEEVGGGVADAVAGRMSATGEPRRHVAASLQLTSTATWPPCAAPVASSQGMGRARGAGHLTIRAARAPRSLMPLIGTCPALAAASVG